MAGVDARLLEKTRYGMIPIAAENLKPFNAYAAPFDQAKAACCKIQLDVRPSSEVIEKIRARKDETKRPALHA